MKHSIRTFLLINLLLSVTLITSLAILGNLFLTHTDTRSEFDARLNQDAIRTLILFADYPHEKKFSHIQQALNHSLTTKLNTKNNRFKQPYIHEDSEQFQLWDNHHHLVLHSPGAPLIPLSHQHNGLSTEYIDKHQWRVSSLYDTQTQFTIKVGSHSSYRQHLENQLTEDSIIIMIITYPFLGLLIWMIIGSGLKPLENVAEEVKYRDPSFLEPVDIELVPTEVEPLVSELNNLFTRLQNSFAQHERFTSDAAHELKTPLAALSAQTQVALRTENAQDRNQALLKVLGGVNRCTHVVQQLLTLSRMCPDAGINDPTEISLSRQARDMASMLAPEAIAKNIELELINPDIKAKFTANAIAIGILIRNLVDNAIRYGFEGGFVTIIISEDHDTVTLRVVDNGPGIPEELRKRVFERFFRIIGNKMTGSGLGLGIVQQIVRLHNAKIELLLPESGQGLEVKVIFPRNPLKAKSHKE